MPKPLPFCATALLVLTSCAEPAAVAASGDMSSSPPPALVPVESLLAQADAGRVTEETGQSLAARGAALRQKANAIATD